MLGRWQEKKVKQFDFMNVVEKWGWGRERGRFQRGGRGGARGRGESGEGESRFFSFLSNPHIHHSNCWVEGLDLSIWPIVNALNWKGEDGLEGLEGLEKN